ncbi:MAG: DUF2262 domain-containing protein [Acidobacteria bacterium]|nr:DUF2262 domain-containing protein [Acidobacteriota bacterium]MCA1643061.1 DUF2262 domain-containing protein [Acidobacteriota bacterium]
MLKLADGKTVRFTIDGMDELITPAVWNAIDFLVANEPLMRHKVAGSMIERYQDWNDGETITPEELARRIELDDVTFLTEGGGELVYTAGDIFTDHCICVPFDANYEIDEPQLEG